MRWMLVWRREGEVRREGSVERRRKWLVGNVCVLWLVCLLVVSLELRALARADNSQTHTRKRKECRKKKKKKKEVRAGFEPATFWV